MGNCLVTKLKGVVTNDNLSYLGKISIKFLSDSTKGVAIKGTGNVNVVGDGTVSIFDGPQNVTETIIIPSYARIFSPSAANVKVIVDKYDITEINNTVSHSAASVELNLDDLKYSTELAVLRLENCPNVSGNIENLPASIVNVDFERIPNIYGNAEHLHGINATFDFVGCPNITGDAAVIFGNNPDMLRFYVDLSGITGSINSCACINLISLAPSASMTGEINTMAQSMVAAERASGTLVVSHNGKITYNGEVINANKTVKFGSDMVNPTAEETAQGYQVV